GSRCDWDKVKSQIYTPVASCHLCALLQGDGPFKPGRRERRVTLQALKGAVDDLYQALIQINNLRTERLPMWCRPPDVKKATPIAQDGLFYVGRVCETGLINRCKALIYKKSGGREGFTSCPRSRITTGLPVLCTSNMPPNVPPNFGDCRLPAHCPFSS